MRGMRGTGWECGKSALVCGESGWKCGKWWKSVWQCKESRRKLKYSSGNDIE